MPRWALIVTVATALFAGCGITLEQCLERDVESLTPQEQSDCFQYASDALQTGHGDRQRIAELRAQLPAPTPTPVPMVDVGFLRFSYAYTREYSDPAELVMFNIENLSGIARSIDRLVWSARDSNGNHYSPALISFRDLMETEGQDCWQGSALRPGGVGCRVGYIWLLQEPNVTITEVRYDGVRLPLPRTR